MRVGISYKLCNNWYELFTVSSSNMLLSREWASGSHGHPYYPFSFAINISWTFWWMSTGYIIRVPNLPLQPENIWIKRPTGRTDRAGECERRREKRRQLSEKVTFLFAFPSTAKSRAYQMVVSRSFTTVFSQRLNLNSIYRYRS